VTAWKLALVAIGLTLIALTPPAAADAKRIKSRIAFAPFGFIEPSGGVKYYFSGQVAAQGFRFKCMEHRRVRVFRDEPSGDDTLIGSDRSNFLGAFLAAVVTDLDQVPGDYYATMKQKKVRTPSGKLRCTGDRTQTVTVRAPDID
jgi:hypothetical protein